MDDKGPDPRWRRSGSALAILWNFEIFFNKTLFFPIRITKWYR